SVVVRAPNGDVLASGGGVGTGELQLASVRAAAAGVFTFEVGAPVSQTGAYALHLQLNVVWEAEELGAGTNDTRESAQSLEDVFTTSDGIAERALIQGRAAAAGNAPFETEPNDSNQNAIVLNQNWVQPSSRLYQLQVDAAQDPFSDVDWFR